MVQRHLVDDTRDFSIAQAILSCFFFGIFTLVSLDGISQNWQIEKLPEMPEAVSNNAVCSAIVQDTNMVFSFAGIDSSKKYTGIHNKSFSFNTVSNKWKRIKSLPDSLGGVIAAGASSVEGKIYIMGGYHVYPNGSEKSSYENRQYDPINNTYQRKKDIPIPIDDHVQVVYKHYIYLISGWTHTINGGNNTNAVQIYDTRNDTWLVGTSTPNSTKYKVFGASGAIIENKIFYIGGARYGTNFPLMDVLRIGEIDENDPSIISWQDIRTFESFKPYRSVLFPLKSNSSLHCLGGSQKPYNYNGIAYDGSGGVEVSNEIVNYRPAFSQWSKDTLTKNINMDLRGYGNVSNTELILCGGMEEDQKVSSKVYKLSFVETLNLGSLPHENQSGKFLYKVENQNIILMENGEGTLRIMNCSGKKLLQSSSGQLDIKLLPPGVYIIEVSRGKSGRRYNKIGICE